MSLHPRDAWHALLGRPTPSELARVDVALAERRKFLESLEDSLATARRSWSAALHHQIQQAADLAQAKIENSWAKVVINALVHRAGGTVHLTRRDLSQAGSTLSTEQERGGVTITASRSN